MPAVSKIKKKRIKNCWKCFQNQRRKETKEQTIMFVCKSIHPLDRAKIALRNTRNDNNKLQFKSKINSPKRMFLNQNAHLNFFFSLNELSPHQTKKKNYSREECSLHTSKHT